MARSNGTNEFTAAIPSIVESAALQTGFRLRNNHLEAGNHDRFGARVVVGMIKFRNVIKDRFVNHLMSLNRSSPALPSRLRRRCGHSVGLERSARP